MAQKRDTRISDPCVSFTNDQIEQRYFEKSFTGRSFLIIFGVKIVICHLVAQDA